jgi:hypothetical protein
VEKFSGTLKSQGFAISKDTVHQLLAHLEDCFLVRLVWMESASERQRMVNPRVPGRSSIDRAVRSHRPFQHWSRRRQC